MFKDIALTRYSLLLAPGPLILAPCPFPSRAWKMKRKNTRGLRLAGTPEEALGQQKMKENGRWRKGKMRSYVLAQTRRSGRGKEGRRCSALQRKRASPPTNRSEPASQPNSQPLRRSSTAAGREGGGTILPWFKPPKPRGPRPAPAHPYGASGL